MACIITINFCIYAYVCVCIYIYICMLHSHPQHLAYLWHKPPESQFPRRWKRSGSDSEANVESLNLCSCQPFYHDSTPHHSSAKDSVRNPMTARLKGISLSLLHWSNPEGQKFPTLSVLRHNIKRSMTGKLTWGCWLEIQVHAPRLNKLQWVFFQDLLMIALFLLQLLLHPQSQEFLYTLFVNSIRAC